MDLVDRFLCHVRARGLLPPRAACLLACSGGGDSRALLELLGETRGPLGLGDVVVAHLDHALRADSGREAASVAAAAAVRGMASVVERRPVVAEPGESPEEAARRVRLRFLADAAARTGATLVLTAHQADDQAETVLLRILRGTGVAGLAGIPERRALSAAASTPALVRPLLPFRRDELRAWLRGRGVAWHDDPTNRSGNERARIRNVALPALAEVAGRDPVPLLVRLAAHAASGTQPEAAAIPLAFLDRHDDGVLIRRGFERLPRALQALILRAVVPPLRDGRPLTASECERLTAALAGRDAEPVSGLSVDEVPEGRRVAASPPPDEPAALPETPVALPGEAPLPDGRVLRLSLAAPEPAVFLARLGRRDGALEIADADALRGPLRVRARRAGDVLQPLGGARPQRLGHLLQRRGVPARDRERVPLVCDAEGIVWAAGAALAERVRVTEATRRIAVLELVAPRPESNRAGEPSGPPAP